MSKTFDKVVEIHPTEKEPWYDILTPFQLTYEYCRGSSPGDFCNVLMISPLGSHYRTCSSEEFNARPAHKHNYFELLMVLKGSVYQKIEGKEFIYPSGSCCLISPNLSHMETFSQEAHLLFIGLSRDLVTELLDLDKTVYFQQEKELNENVVFRFLKARFYSDHDKCHLDFFPKHPRQSFADANLYRISDSLVSTAFLPQLGSTYMVKGLICSLMRHLSDESVYHHTLVRLDSHTDLLLFSRITHLLEDTDGRLSRSELEGLLNYNGSYINTIVKRHTGMCLYDYGMTFCLKKAALLLSTTNESIVSIAARLNFTNRTHFYTLFKKKYGETPGEYRERVKNENML
ncbi:MAG: AraC family transcriptional regulator [Eubacteriales bacterium]|nr:AraC family transcriptional regulator [Eubacteriales bacterium]